MLENVLAGIIVAALVGLPTVAIKYPELYARCLPYMVGLVLVGASFVWGWNYGVNAFLVAVHEFIAAEDGHKALEAHRGSMFDSLHAFWIPAVLLGYIGLCLLLPKAIELSKKDYNKKKA